MAADVFASLVGVGGVAIGAGLTMLNDWRKDRSGRSAARLADYRSQLRMACAAHAVNLSSYVSRVLQAGPAVNSDGALEREIGLLHQQARMSIEQIRLLSDSLALQEAARLALRHAYAIKETSAGRPDPRPDVDGPYKRYDAEFKKFLAEARRELGLAHPDDVYGAP